MPDITLKPVAQQVVVVMGASSGIGRATAARFAKEGAKVVVAARGEQGLRSLVEEIRADGGGATADVADATAPAPPRPAGVRPRPPPAERPGASGCVAQGRAGVAVGGLVWGAVWAPRCGPPPR